MNQTCRPADRRALFDEIGAVSFVMDELRLYLDTHPDCGEALSLFRECAERRRDLTSRYAEAFGPLDSYGVPSDGWGWNRGPGSWEREAN